MNYTLDEPTAEACRLGDLSAGDFFQLADFRTKLYMVVSDPEHTDSRVRIMDVRENRIGVEPPHSRVIRMRMTTRPTFTTWSK